MTRRFSIAPLLMVVLAGSALAQTPEGSVPANPPAPNAPPPQPDKNATPPQNSPGQLDADGNYTIKGGDTLWDLSQQFLNNPWYWPKIWADNPSVENPHWIYPGNRLKISRRADGLPGEVGPAATTSDDSDANKPIEEDVGSRPKEMADFSKGSIGGPTPEGSDEVTTGGAYRMGMSAVPTVSKVHVASIITDRELADSGTITHSIEQKTLLTTYDKVFAKITNLQDVKVGSTYTIFRTGDRITHPTTGQPFGYQTILVGTLDIVGKTPTEAIAVIGNIIEGVERGDRLAPHAELDKAIHVVPNETDLAGVVLTTQVPGLAFTGENHVVFIDKGAADGVKDGNTFTVVQAGDGLEQLTLPGHLADRHSGPPEPVATLIVFNVSEHSSAALVVKSLREVNTGDRVEMKRASVAATGAGGDVGLRETDRGVCGTTAQP
jgi:hypothetical protein